MKFYITSAQDIVSKDGRRFRKYTGLKASGEAGEIFLSGDQVDKFVVPSTVMVSADDLNEFLGGQMHVDVQYNERGRVEALEIASS